MLSGTASSWILRTCQQGGREARTENTAAPSHGRSGRDPICAFTERAVSSSVTRRPARWGEVQPRVDERRQQTYGYMAAGGATKQEAAFVHQG